MKHYHRCEWCGCLWSCDDTCGQGGPFDPYTDGQGNPPGGERNPDGTFYGGYCDTLCCERKRPRGSRYQKVPPTEKAKS